MIQCLVTVYKVAEQGDKNGKVIVGVRRHKAFEVN